MLVVRGQIDRPTGLLKRLLGGVGAQQRLGADGPDHRLVGRSGHQLIAHGHGADVVPAAQGGKRPIDQVLLDIRFISIIRHRALKPRQHSIILQSTARRAPGRGILRT